MLYTATFFASGGTMESPLQIFENWFDAMAWHEREECASAFASYVLTPVTGVAAPDHQQRIDELKAVLERARANKREDFIIQILKLFFDQYLNSWLFNTTQLGTREDFMMVKRARQQAGLDGPEQTEAELQQEYELKWMQAELHDARMERHIKRWHELESFFTWEYYEEYLWYRFQQELQATADGVIQII
jgi:hypothetical protein